MRVTSQSNPSSPCGESGPAVWLILAVLLFPSLEVFGLEATASSPVLFAGRTLTEALGLLENEGLRIVFNSRVVSEDLRVVSRPTATDPRGILLELLEPHGLMFREGPGGRLVVVREERLRQVRGWVRNQETGNPISQATLEPSGTAPTRTREDGSFVLELAVDEASAVDVQAIGFAPRRIEILKTGVQDPLVFELTPLPPTFDEIAVTPSQLTLKRQRASDPLSLGKDLALTLPGLADDPIRGLKVVPGITGDDTSARLSVRGGPVDGTQLFLDGLELLEPFHLQDFGGASSIVAPEAIESVDIMTGTVPAEHRGRSGGVVDMHSLVPEGKTRTRLGVGLLDSHLLRSGRFPQDRGYWFGIARLGTFDPALRFGGRRDQPNFWDLFGKAELRIGEARTLTARVLVADDHLEDFTRSGEDAVEALGTRYRSNYLWGSYSATVSDRLFSETTLSYTLLDRTRLAEETGPEIDFVLDDSRDLNQFGLTQDLSYFLNPRHSLAMGLDVRHLNARFRYSSEVETTDPLAVIRTGSASGAFVGDLREEQWSLYASDLYRPFEFLTLHLGLRFEEYTLTDRSDLTPRLALAFWLPGERVLRLSWGSFVQNQRPYELQLTDGETEFAVGERSEQAILSFEQPLARKLTLRVEAYRRTTSNPRPRFVNLFESRTPVPEVQSDRVRISPERSEAEGVELLLRSATKKQSWWIHYARSESRHRIAGREFSSSVDQPDAFTLQYERRIGRRWRAGAVWRYHSGWPTTPVTADEEPGETGELILRPRLGELFSDRLPTYHRLDLRVNRVWRVGRGKLETYVNVQNAYDRKNVRGYEFEFVSGPEDPIVDREEKLWRGLFTSAGISWSF